MAASCCRWNASQLSLQKRYPAHVNPPSLRPRVQTCHTSTVCMAQKQTFKSFDDLIANSDVPVLVDFYATWCGPCQLIAPDLKWIADKTEGRLKVVKIDTDKYSDIATRFKIEGLPTLVLFKGGKPILRKTGVHPRDELMRAIEAKLVD